MGWFKNLSSGIGGVLTAGTMSHDDAMSFIPGIGDASAQDAANKANLNESAVNREFQKSMSNTAYQRAMQDMKAAGLNPMLAISQGGASTPSGSTATVSPASKTGLADFALKATTGLGGLSQQATALQQQQSMNESSIKLNNTTAAKNLQDAEKTRLNNIKERKYEKIHGAAGRVGDKAASLFNSLIDATTSSGKQQQSNWKKAMDITVLGKSNKPISAIKPQGKK